MDAEGFDTLVATHHREIYRYLVRATFRASEADDLAQETFLRAYRAHRALPPDANARAWLFAIASNVAKNHFRAESRRRRADTGATAIRTDADAAAGVGGLAHACAPGRQGLARSRAIEDAVGAGRGAPAPAEELAHARLESRLAALRRRTLLYRIFPSPLGPILIARSEEGVSCVEYLTGGADFAHSRLSRDEGIEALLDGAEVEALYRDLLEYVEGRRTRLEWPLDLRLARSEFHRTVLETTARIPYGAVRSYAGVARELGKPSATRAVAQALRWNPLRSEEHTSELQSQSNLVCRLLLEKKK